MHWSSRVMIGMLAGMLAGPIAALPLLRVHYPTITVVVDWPLFYLWFLGVTAGTAIGVYAWVTKYAQGPLGPETRCRKCQYILRGITEPRCPECGERI